MLSRRYLQVLAVIATVSLTNATGVPPSEAPPEQKPEAPVFSFETVDRLARQRAASPYNDPSPELPKSLLQLGYDEYRDIRFKADHALWRGESLFEVQFFHRGFNFTPRVNVYEVDGDNVRQLQYDPAAFDFAKLDVPRDLPPQTGFGGFRVHYPLHTPLYKDELIVFLGASYFRVLGRNQGYGISARGLAVDAATERGEEFPRFTDFWLVRPEPFARTLTMYALLDSESVAGAYRFDVRPGSITQVEVSGKLYPRRSINKLGIAPLTSMFLFGEDPSGRRFDDFRPEVHDSDGLMMQTGRGEWLYRPLRNPKLLRVSAFLDENPRGFGLTQRDRDFEHYQDNESRFERRPSYWVEPLGRWGKGRVELMEIPSNEEIHDNIVAFWVPDTAVEASKPISFSYLLSSFAESPRWPPGGKAIATRTGTAYIGGYGKDRGGEMRRFVIDFAGGDLADLDKTQPVKANVTASRGEVDAVTVEQLPDGRTWRVAFRLKPDGNEPAELRCFLSLYDEALTETWTYPWVKE